MSDQFFGAYYAIVTNCLKGERSVEETNRRTGQKIRILDGGTSFMVDLRDGVLPVPQVRVVKPHIAAAETAWCFMGHSHVDWLRRHTKVWDQFADPSDCAQCEGAGQLGMGGTCPTCQGSGKTLWLNEAYGYRWRFAFGVDQLMTALARLRKDPSDRRVWISSWDPREDIEDKGQKTVPCPVGFTLSTVAGRLNSTLMIRSSDLYMGLPYDVMRHALVMAACAASIGVRLGVARFCLAHPHIYESNWSDASRMLVQRPVDSMIMMPDATVQQIIDKPDEYVAGVKIDSDRASWPNFTGESGVVA